MIAHSLLWYGAIKLLPDIFAAALNATAIFAGHNPKNTASCYVLEKLGFQYIGDEYYEPTGLYHPSYELLRHID